MLMEISTLRLSMGRTMQFPFSATTAPGCSHCARFCTGLTVLPFGLCAGTLTGMAIWILQQPEATAMKSLFVKPGPQVSFTGGSSISAESTGSLSIPARVTTADGGPLVRDLIVSYNTSDGTARAPGDYSAASGTLTFTVGQPAESPRTST